MSKKAAAFIKKYQEKHKTGAWDSQCTQAYSDEVNKELIDTLKEIANYKLSDYEDFGDAYIELKYIAIKPIKQLGDE